MKLILATLSLVFAASLAQAHNDCSTLEKAKAGLLAYAQSGKYPYSPYGQYTLADFNTLESVETSDEVFCHVNGEDCGSTDIAFGMTKSFEPGVRGWIGITTTCEIDYAATFRD